LAHKLGLLLCSLSASITCLQVTANAPASAQSSWAVAPLSVSAYASYLGAVSCAGSSFCVAVGYTHADESNAVDRPLIEQWNGKKWYLTKSPAGREGAVLTDVSCTSASFCMLVGFTERSRSKDIVPITEQWNGNRWNIVSNASEGENATGISCVGVSFCAVVGYNTVENGGPSSTTFGEVWNGTTWTATPTPSPGTIYSFLSGVSCVASDSCVAIGYSSSDGSSVEVPSLALAWNGSTWSQFPSQNGSDPAGLNILTGVTCLATLSSCTAAGSYVPSAGSGAAQSLVESWTPTGWVIAPTLDAPGGDEFEGVSCATSSFCVAVGLISDTSELIEEWDGTSWTVSSGVSVPNTKLDRLSGVSCTERVCFAAGEYSKHSRGPWHALLISSAVS
jgi:hypothetical protein